MKRVALCAALVVGLVAGIIAVEFPAGSATKVPHNRVDRKVVVVRGALEVRVVVGVLQERTARTDSRARVPQLRSTSTVGLRSRSVKTLAP